MGRWGLFERCFRLGEAGEPEDNQQSTFAHTHTSSSHSTTSPWSHNPYPHCVLTTKNIGKPVREPGPLDGQRQTLSPRCCFPHATQPAEALVRRDLPTEKDIKASDRLVHTGLLAIAANTVATIDSPETQAVIVASDPPS